MLEITTVEQNGLLRGAIRPVRVGIIQGGRSLASGERPSGNRRNEAAEIGGGSCGNEGAEAEEK